MEVKCSTCEKSFSPSVISYHINHCHYKSHGDQCSGKKRSIGESDSVGASVSYPRKRPHYSGRQSPAVAPVVAHYPKRTARDNDGWSSSAGPAPAWPPPGRSSGPAPVTYSRQQHHRRNSGRSVSVAARGARRYNSSPPDRRSQSRQKQRTTPTRPRRRHVNASSAHSSRPTHAKDARSSHVGENTCLTDVMRPSAPSELVGQGEALTAARQCLDPGNGTNLILWGPHGSGKSSIGEVLHASRDGGVRRVLYLRGAAISPAALHTLSSSSNCVLFLDDVHFLSAQLQIQVCRVLDSCASTVLVAACSRHPQEVVCPALLSRCRVVALQPLSPSHLETIVLRALRRVSARVMDGDNPDSSSCRLIPSNGAIESHNASSNANNIRSILKNPQQLKSSNGSNSSKSVNSDSNNITNNSSNIICDVEIIPYEKPTPLLIELDIQSDNKAEKIKSRAPGLESSATRDNGIEDMSDEEDESILDVLTKGIDQISSEYTEAGEAGLDCVSDDAAPRVALESIDSSEEEIDTRGPIEYSCVGVTRGAISLLCSECGGDARVTLTTLHLLLRQAKATAPRTNTTDVAPVPDTLHKPPPSSTSTQPSQVNYTQFKTRIANYGDSDSLKNDCASTSKSNVEPKRDDTLPTADDISSDEEEVAAEALGITGRNKCAGSLDNVSDVSESSVQDNVPPQLDSDDVLSDAFLSDSEMFDYEEMPKEPNPTVVKDIELGASGRSNVEITGNNHPKSNISEKRMTGTINENNPIELSVNNFKSSNDKLPPNAPPEDRSERAKYRPQTSLAVITVKRVAEILQELGIHTSSSSSDARAVSPCDNPPSLLQALERSVAAGSCDAAVYYIARALRCNVEPIKVADTLLKAAVSVVGVGDVSCVGVAMQCCDALPRLSAPHTHNLLANTALTLTKAAKDLSAVKALKTATSFVSSAPEHPPPDGVVGSRGLPLQLGKITFFST